MCQDITKKILPLIRQYNHHPVRDQRTLDFFQIFANPEATELIISSFVAHILKTQDVGKIVAVICPESQGFLLGPLVAARLKLPCLPVRKKYKLAGEVVRQNYEKWDGEEEVEMQKNAFADIGIVPDRLGPEEGVIIIDDSLASGGTVGAVKKLLEGFGIKVLEALFIVHSFIPKHEEEQKANLDGMEVFGLVYLTEEELAEMPMYQGIAPK